MKIRVFMVAMAVLMGAAIAMPASGQMKQNSNERVKAIRQAYAEAVALPGIDVPEARTELKMNVHRNVPGIGVQDHKIEFFGTTSEKEDDWGLVYEVRLVRVSYNVAARKFYQEYLFDEQGEPMFCFCQYESYFAETVTKEEKRYYFDNRALCSYNYKAKDAETGKELSAANVPDLFDLNDGNDFTDRLADFDFYKKLFNDIMNHGN